MLWIIATEFHKMLYFWKKLWV